MLNLAEFGIIGSDYPDLWKYGGNLPDEFTIFFHRMRNKRITQVCSLDNLMADEDEGKVAKAVLEVYLYASGKCHG